VNGGELRQWTGGKGANQAVAASRLGAAVELIAAVGRDDHGAEALATLHEEGVDTAMVHRIEQVPTGLAVVLVDAAGRNAIALAAGANGCLRPGHVEPHRDRIARAAVLVVQLEVPVDTVAHAVAIAHAAGVPVVLNPAPMATLPPAMLRQVSVLVPNEHEAALVAAGAGLAGHRAADLLATGAGSVIVTLGERGIDVAEPGGGWSLAPQAVDAVDTTGAGDTFIGALAAGLAQRRPLGDAARLAQAAAAISVTRPGAMPSMPRRRELMHLLPRDEENSVA
jgi:ribokinase